MPYKIISSVHNKKNIDTDEAELKASTGVIASYFPTCELPRILYKKILAVKGETWGFINLSYLIKNSSTPVDYFFQSKSPKESMEKALVKGNDLIYYNSVGELIEDLKKR